jgi:hypothetical protein
MCVDCHSLQFEGFVGLLLLCIPCISRTKIQGLIEITEIDAAEEHLLHLRPGFGGLFGLA